MPSSAFSIPEYLSWFDVVVFVAIMLLTVASISFGQYLKDHGATGKLKLIEHLLMGRRLTLPLFVATLVSSWYGGIFGVTEIAFNHGIYNFITQGVFWYVAYLVFAFVLVKPIRQYDAVTLPELVGKMFGARAGSLAAVFNFFNVLPVAYSLSLGIFLQMLLGWNLVASTFLGTGLVCLYSMIGGFRADVFSDVVQFGVMCTAVFMVVLFASRTYGGMDFLHANLPATHFSPMGTESLLNTLVWGLIAAATLVDPNFYQRCFAADEARTVRRGIIISTVIWCGFDLCTTYGAMYARAVLPNVNPSQGYLQFAMQVLPNGWRGFFLAGIVAIIISTLDSFLLIAAQTLSYDLGPQKWREHLNWHRACVVFVGLFAVSLSFFFAGSVKLAWKTLGAYSAGCLLLPMMLGFFAPGVVRERGFIWGAISGAVGITVWRLGAPAEWKAQLDGLYVGIILTAIGIVLDRLVTYIALRISSKPEYKVAKS